MSSLLGHYLDVVTIIAQKHFKIRYRNSVLGFLWSLLNPLTFMLILALVFSFFLRVDVPNFAAWVLIGILVWRFFAIGTGQGPFSIVGNPSLLSTLCLVNGRTRSFVPSEEATRKYLDDISSPLVPADDPKAEEDSLFP